MDFLLLPHPSAAIVATFVAIAALRVEVAPVHLPDTSVESSQVSSAPPLPLAGTCWHLLATQALLNFAAWSSMIRSKQKQKFSDLS